VRFCHTKPFTQLCSTWTDTPWQALLFPCRALREPAQGQLFSERKLVAGRGPGCVYSLFQDGSSQLYLNMRRLIPSYSRSLHLRTWGGSYGRETALVSSSGVHSDQQMQALHKAFSCIRMQEVGIVFGGSGVPPLSP